MAEPDGIDREAGKTVELELGELRGRLPATPDDLRDELPGIEPDRRVDDWGRIDNRRLKASGYVYMYTTREAVLKLRAHQRLRPLLRSGAEPYRYERGVEEFLRWSPSVRSAQFGAERSYDELSPRSPGSN